MSKALVPFNGRHPEPRRGLLAKFFRSIDVQSEADRLRAEHALVRLAIELNTDLTRQRRKAELYLQATKAEDQAAAEVAREVSRRSILESIDEIFADDLITAELLKARVRQIYNGQHGNHKHHKR